MAGTENKTGTYTLADRIREEGRQSGAALAERFMTSSPSETTVT